MMNRSMNRNDYCCTDCHQTDETKGVRSSVNIRYSILKMRYEFAKQEGYTHKMWHTNGANIRPSHRSANRQTVPIDGHFTVDGEKLFLPSDPNAPFKVTANCKCDVDYIFRGKITTNSPKKVIFERCQRLNRTFNNIMDSTEEQQAKFPGINIRIQNAHRTANTQTQTTENDTLLDIILDLAGLAVQSTPVGRIVVGVQTAVNALSSYISGVDKAQTELINELSKIEANLRAINLQLNENSRGLRKIERESNALQCGPFTRTRRQ